MSNESNERVEIPEGVTRALVVTAHPDDVDFGAGGTVMALIKAGAQVTFCICTDGDAGGFDDSTDRSEIPAIRRAEQVAAAAVYGVTDVRFLGYKDGYLEPSHDLQRDIVRVDTTEFFARKVNALEAHASQTSHMENLEDMLRSWGEMQAAAAGFETGRLAEAFRQIKLPD